MPRATLRAAAAAAEAGAPQGSEPPLKRQGSMTLGAVEDDSDFDDQTSSPPACPPAAHRAERAPAAAPMVVRTGPAAEPALVWHRPAGGGRRGPDGVPAALADEAQRAERCLTPGPRGAPVQIRIGAALSIYAPRGLFHMVFQYMLVRSRDLKHWLGPSLPAVPNLIWNGF